MEPWDDEKDAQFTRILERMCALEVVLHPRDYRSRGSSPRPRGTDGLVVCERLNWGVKRWVDGPGKPAPSWRWEGGLCVRQFEPRFEVHR